jgi:hypothetical protein
MLFPVSKGSKLQTFILCTLEKKFNVTLIAFFVKIMKVMGVQKLRQELHDYINNADEIFLKMVYAMSKEL